jgi:CBS domain-containing protein
MQHRPIEPPRVGGAHLAAQASAVVSQAMSWIDQAEAGGDPALLHFAARREAVVRSLREDGASADRIGHLASHLDDHLVRCSLREEIATLEAEVGALPAPWAWVVFGSDGRREQPMLLDQHNALVFDTSRLDLDAAATASEIFHRLATRVSERLRASGLPDAVGGFAAHRWCSTLAEWQRRFRHWLEEPYAEAMEHAQVFFDLRRVAGTLESGLQAHLATTDSHPEFLRLLAAMAVRRRPAVRRWRGLVRNGDGEVDLLEGGLRPLVALARVASLALASASAEGDPQSLSFCMDHGSNDCSTPHRLEMAGQLGLLPRQEADRLIEIYRSLADRILDLQLAATARGKAPAACQRPAELALHARRRLAADLRFLRLSQESLDRSVRRFLRAAASTGGLP